LQFRHLNLLLVCLFQNTHHIVFVWHFEAIDHYFALWAIWFGLPCGVVWGWSTLPPPVILCIRGAQGQDCLLSVHCLSVSVSSLHCHFQVPCFSLKAFPKISCTQNTTDRDCVANGMCIQGV
jgi:hypothetical protein